MLKRQDQSASKEMSDTVIRDDLFAKGLEQRRAMFGVAGADEQINNTSDLTDKIQDFVTRSCFGDIWQREGLTTAERSKITLSMLIATGRTHEMRIHMRGALENGVTVLEIREIAIHSMLYCGIPAAVEGVRALEEILSDRGISSDLDGESLTKASGK